MEAKLAEHRIKPYTLAVKEHQVERFGPYECEFIAVNHSIPDALAVFIRTGAGTVLHTGDFKMDQLPLDGRITDLRHFAKLGEEGIDLFLPDSTNAEVPGFTPTEKNIGPVISNVPGRNRAYYCGIILVSCAPCAAGSGCCCRARPQGGAGGPLDGS